MNVPVVLTSVGVGAQRVADDAVCPFHLGFGVFVAGRADDQAHAHVLDEGVEHLARELGIMIHPDRRDEHVEKAGPFGPEHASHGPCGSTAVLGFRTLAGTMQHALLPSGITSTFAHADQPWSPMRGTARQ